jgi:alkaline phosphatase D
VTTFVRGARYVEYETGAEGELERAPDAVVEAFGATYAFFGRDYAHWDHARRAIAGPLRRIGSPYGHGLPDGKGGGWPGASHLLAGPLVGPITPRIATIWVWTIDRSTADRLRVRSHGVAVAPDVRDLVAPSLRPSVDAVSAGSQIVALELRGLMPGQHYELELLLGDEVLDRIELRTPVVAYAGRASFVVGSCSDLSAFRDAPVFDRMAERRADAALLLGDNCYYINALGESSDSFWKGGWLRADWDDPVRMLKRQLAARNQPELARLARTTATHATWDDHDFGYNNAGGRDDTSWVGRELAAAIHRAMWGGSYVVDGPIYYTFRIGPVEVFVTDSRYDKEPRNILGSTQLAWLVDAMVSSDAPLKILALSSQLLYRRKSESFVIDAPEERTELLAALERVRGRVLVVSGDVHYSELARYPVSETPRILELTSSGIRTGETDEAIPEWLSGARLWIAQADAFAVVAAEIEGWRGDTAIGTLTLEARDDRGELLRDGDRPCRTIWDLATGAVRQG